MPPASFLLPLGPGGQKSVHLSHPLPPEIVKLRAGGGVLLRVGIPEAPALESQFRGSQSSGLFFILCFWLPSPVCPAHYALCPFVLQLSFMARAAWGAGGSWVAPCGSVARALTLVSHVGKALLKQFNSSFWGC